MGLDALEDIGIGSGQEAIVFCQQLLLVKVGGAQARPYHAVGLPLQHKATFWCHQVAVQEKQRDAFLRHFHEKLSVELGCPGRLLFTILLMPVMPVISVKGSVMDVLYFVLKQHSVLMLCLLLQHADLHADDDSGLNRVVLGSGCVHVMYV